MNVLNINNILQPNIIILIVFTICWSLYLIAPSDLVLDHFILQVLRNDLHTQFELRKIKIPHGLYLNSNVSSSQFTICL